MKSPWPILASLFAVCAIGAASLWQSQSRQTAALDAQVTRLKTNNARLNSDLTAANERAQALESESAQLRAVRALAAARPAPAPATPAPTPDDRRGGLLSRMFKDPEMRKMIAAQQAMVLHGLYSDFVKQAHLTPDETQQFFKLIDERQMALMDSSAGVLSGSGVDMNAVQAAGSMADDALKNLLGSQRFGEYQGFEKTLGERVQVQQLNQQLSAEGVPLQDNQSQALVQIMTQEYANIPNLQTPNGGGTRQMMNMSSSDIEHYSEQVAEANQRVYNRAMAVLNPQQLDAFGTFQKTMATAQTAGLKMAQQMLKGN